MNKGIGGHVPVTPGERSDDWITPPQILDALGPFDLDPAASASQPWRTAARMISPPDDGRLASLWTGRVWLNPPYSDVEPWLERLANHGNGIALVFARTETKWFQRLVFGEASAILFLAGRITFLRPDGSRPAYTAGGPSVLVAYDDYSRLNANYLVESEVPGQYFEPGARLFRPHNPHRRITNGQ